MAKGKEIVVCGRDGCMELGGICYTILKILELISMELKIVNKSVLIRSRPRPIFELSCS